MDLMIADEKELVFITEQFAKVLLPGINIYLSGPLGVGKTTWVRGVLRALGYKNKVKSPTYTLVEPYQCDHFMVYHLDLYRLADAEELYYLGVQEQLSGSTVSFIEWPEKAAGMVPEADIVINIAFKESARRIHFVSQSVKGAAIINAMIGTVGE